MLKPKDFRTFMVQVNKVCTTLDGTDGGLYGTSLDGVIEEVINSITDGKEYKPIHSGYEASAEANAGQSDSGSLQGDGSGLPTNSSEQETTEPDAGQPDAEIKADGALEATEPSLFDEQNKPTGDEGSEKNPNENNLGATSSAEMETSCNAENDFVRNIVDILRTAVSTVVKDKLDIRSIRRLANQSGLKVDALGADDIMLQELIERAIASYCIDVVGQAKKEGKPEREIFETIKKIYEMQPSIMRRDSNKIKLQQYSTTIPIAYLAGFTSEMPNLSLNLQRETDFLQ